MKTLLSILLLISLSVQAEEKICKDYEIKKENAFNWAESSFNEERAKESMEALEYALKNQGSINSCGLHNALQIVEVYIQKQQALKALSAKNAPEAIVKMEVLGFCEFIQRSKPCE